MTSAGAHVYRGAVTLGGTDSLSKVAARIAPGSTVLDVGTGAGGLGAFLAHERGCTVDGVTHNPAEAELARAHYRRLVTADLDSASLEELFGAARYDYVVLADVLEHLRHPERTLAASRALLGGRRRVVASLPNVAYAGVIAGLCAGEFIYSEEGILDSTHVRFFTRSSLVDLFAGCGLTPVGWDAVVRPVSASEFGHHPPDALAPALVRALSAHPDALVYQLILEASDNPDATPVVLEPPPSPGLAFVVQLFHATADEPFVEARSHRALGRIGVERQTVRLPIGAAGALRLRLNPAERPGSLTLWGLRIVSPAGEIVWTWNGRPDGFAAASGLVVCATGFGAHGVVLGIVSEDPALELALDGVELPSGCTLECELGWPLSSDTLALSQIYREEQAAQAGLLDAERAHVAELERVLAAERAARADVIAMLERTRAEHAAARDALAAELHVLRTSLYARIFGKPRP